MSKDKGGSAGHKEINRMTPVQVEIKNGFQKRTLQS
jgi:hypothetical protein